MGGGSAVDTSIVDSSSLGFTNVQEFADYILAQMNNKVNSDKLGEYVHNQAGEWVSINSIFVFKPYRDDGDYWGGKFAISHPLSPNTCKMKDAVYVKTFNESVVFQNYNFNNDSTWRTMEFNIGRIPSNSWVHVMDTAWCRPVSIQTDAPAETNFLWAY